MKRSQKLPEFKIIQIFAFFERSKYSFSLHHQIIDTQTVNESKENDQLRKLFFMYHQIFRSCDIARNVAPRV